MLLDLWAHMTGGLVVIISDFDGDQKKVVARKHIGESYKARGHSGEKVILLPDGRVAGSKYGRHWWRTP